MSANQNSEPLALFFTNERQQRLDLVTHLIPNSRQPILLRGPEASGKSFFIGQFVKQAPKSWLVFAIEADELAISPIDSIELAVNAMQHTDKPIQSRLSAWSNQEKVVVALVEGAHLLGSSCFEQLLQLSGDYSCLRLVVTSSENLGDGIEDRCQLIDLEPFTQKQTVEYAKARVNSKGLDFVNLAGIDDVVLFIETGGLPGRINDVLEQMQTNPLRGDIVKTPSSKLFILSAVVGSIVLALFFTYGLWDDNVVDEGPAISISLEKGLLSDEPAKQERLTDVIKPQEQASVPTKLVTAQDEANDENHVAELVVEKKKKITKALAPLIEPSPPMVEETAEGAVQSKVVKSIITPPKPDVKVVEKMVKKTPLMLHHEWLRSQPPKNYTLQLMGVSEEQSIKQYIASKEDVKGLRYFRHKRNNGAWYTVIYGMYAEKGLAEKAAKSLPKQLKNIKPWVRSIESVNADIFQ